MPCCTLDEGLLLLLLLLEVLWHIYCMCCNVSGFARCCCSS
jgi:hypothetical protein